MRSTGNIDVVEIDVPPKPKYIGLVRLIASSLARKLNLTDDEIYDVKIAVSELSTNAITHASKNTDEPVKVRFELNAETITITIVDRGPGFDTSTIRTSIDGLREQGFGLILAQNLMDSFDCKSSSKGTVVTIKKRSGIAKS